jgi:hypothetical protein
VDGKAGGVVAAHDLAAVVDPVGRGLEDGVGVVDRCEPPPVEEKAGAERVDGFVDDAAQRRRVLGCRGRRACYGERGEEEGGGEADDPETTDARARWHLPLFAVSCRVGSSQAHMGEESSGSAC